MTRTPMGLTAASQFQTYGAQAMNAAISGTLNWCNDAELCMPTNRGIQQHSWFETRLLQVEAESTSKSRKATYITNVNANANAVSKDKRRDRFDQAESEPAAHLHDQRQKSQSRLDRWLVSYEQSTSTSSTHSASENAESDQKVESDMEKEHSEVPSKVRTTIRSRRTLVPDSDDEDEVYMAVTSTKSRSKPASLREDTNTTSYLPEAFDLSADVPLGSGAIDSFKYGNTRNHIRRDSLGKKGTTTDDLEHQTTSVLDCTVSRDYPRLTSKQTDLSLRSREKAKSTSIGSKNNDEGDQQSYFITEGDQEKGAFMSYKTPTDTNSCKQSPASNDECLEVQPLSGKRSNPFVIDSSDDDAQSSEMVMHYGKGAQKERSKSKGKGKEVDADQAEHSMVQSQKAAPPKRDILKQAASGRGKHSTPWGTLDYHRLDYGIYEDLVKPDKCVAFMQMARDYMNHLRELRPEDADGERENVEKFLYMINNEIAWPLVKTVIPEFRHPIIDINVNNHAFEYVLTAVRDRTLEHMVRTDYLPAYEQKLVWDRTKATIDYLSFIQDSDTAAKTIRERDVLLGRLRRAGQEPGTRDADVLFDDETG